MPHQVIYSSRSTTPMQADDLDDILECARENNAAAGITGALVYVDGFFLQILEGDADAVQELMGRIVKDVRHEAVTLLKSEAVAADHFNGWSMAYVGATAEQVAQWAGFAGTCPVPATVAGIQGEPQRVTQLTEHIVSLLAAAPGQ